MITVRVSLTVYLDLDSRDVAAEYGITGTGKNAITAEQAASLADECSYQADSQHAGYGNPVGLRNAYSALRRQIRKATA